MKSDFGIVRFDGPVSTWLLDKRSGTANVCCLKRWHLNDWTRTASERDAEWLASEIVPALEFLIGTEIDSLLSTPPVDYGEVARVREVRFDDGEVTDRLLIPHPACSHEPEPVAPDFTDLPESPTGPSLRAASVAKLRKGPLALAVDQAIGPVRKVFRQNDGALSGSAAAALYSPRGRSQTEFGYGRSGRWGDDPALAAIEAVERFTGTSPVGGADHVVASYEELGRDAIDPEAFILHDPGRSISPRHGLTPYSPCLKIGWIRAYSFRRDAPVLVPTQLAYYAPVQDQLRNSQFVFEVSNGCAAGGSIAEATLFGLLEVIERDAYLVSWYSGRRLQSIDPWRCKDDQAMAILARLTAEGLEIDVLDIGVGLPGTAVAVEVHDPKRRFGPSLTCFSAAHVDPGRALRAALNEAMTSTRFSTSAQRRQNDERARALFLDPDGVRIMDDHVIQGWPPEARKIKCFSKLPARLGWQDLMDVSPRADNVSLSRVLEHCVEKTLTSADDVLVVDQSISAFSRRGLHCVKVLAPGLLPMTFGHANRRLKESRVLSFADGGTGMRADPHLFP